MPPFASYNPLYVLHHKEITGLQQRLEQTDPVQTSTPIRKIKKPNKMKAANLSISIEERKLGKGLKETLSKSLEEERKEEKRKTTIQAEDLTRVPERDQENRKIRL
ncbi:hypothetical protein ACJMK2_022869, partial [Sinanodonta woodiana]